MYLHIGKGVTVREKKIIGIFDLDSVSRSQAGRKFLSESEKKKCVIYEDEDIPRSFVLCERNDDAPENNIKRMRVLRKDRKDYVIHLSHISSKGLLSRAEIGVNEKYDEQDEYDE